MNNGIVYIAGAGPGDVGLVTLKAYEKLKIADSVLYDNLANSTLLDFCKPDAEKVFVGKVAGKHYVTQDEIIRLMITKAKEGKIVVRLKGGDPLIFGRGSEEAIALFNENIPFEIIPGISAAIAASAYSGIPLTHRNIVTQCIFITAHEAPEKSESQINWEMLAKIQNATLAIYMGAAMLPKIASFLISSGRKPSEKIAIIQSASLPEQKTYITSLSEVEDTIINENIQPPIITLVGPTVNLQGNMTWFENKPLYGKRIVITRAAKQSHSLKEMLYDVGANVIQMSTLKIELSIPKLNLKNLFSEHFDWVIFTSENGVRNLFELLDNNNLDSRAFFGKKIAAIGTATAKSLNDHGLIPDFIPSNFTSVSLINEMKENNWIEGKRFLRVKGDFKYDYVSEKISEFGGNIYNLEVYKTLQEDINLKVLEDLKNNGADAVVFTSTSTVNNFFNMLGADTAKELLTKCIAIAIGPITAVTLESKGIQNIRIASIHNSEGVIAELINLFKFSMK